MGRVLVSGRKGASLTGAKKTPWAQTSLAQPTGIHTYPNINIQASLYRPLPIPRPFRQRRAAARSSGAPSAGPLTHTNPLPRPRLPAWQLFPGIQDGPGPRHHRAAGSGAARKWSAIACPLPHTNPLPLPRPSLEAARLAASPRHPGQPTPDQDAGSRRSPYNFWFL
jgi:hypothetical protein